jgi:hypothetical protein
LAAALFLILGLGYTGDHSVSGGETDFTPPFLYRCPNTCQTVQGFTAEEVAIDAYEAITCLACRQNHFVNATTGKVLGEDADE